MFNALKTPITIYTVKKGATNGFNEPSSTEFEETGTCNMFISLNTKSFYTGNDMNILDCEFVGVTNYQNLEVGQYLDKKYEIRFLQPHAGEYFVFLKEVANDGRF